MIRMKKVARKKVEQRWCGCVTDELKKQVAICAFAGMCHDDIARKIGCDTETLIQHFQHELENAREALRQRVVKMVRKSAREGSVPAKRLLYKITSGQPIDGRGRWKRPRKPIKPVLGKKALRQLEAEEHDEIFSPPPAPRLVVDNEKPKKR